MADPAQAERGPQAMYESFLEQGRFMIQRSRATGEYVFWPKVMAPSGAQDLDWVEASGLGTVYAATVNRGRDSATNVVLVDLAEGPRMMAHVVGVEAPAIGLAVRARVQSAEEAGGAPRVVFEPVEGGAV